MKIRPKICNCERDLYNEKKSEKGKFMFNKRLSFCFSPSSLKEPERNNLKKKSESNKKQI